MQVEMQTKNLQKYVVYKPQMIHLDFATDEQKGPEVQAVLSGHAKELVITYRLFTSTPKSVTSRYFQFISGGDPHPADLGVGVSHPADRGYPILPNGGGGGVTHPS